MAEAKVEATSKIEELAEKVAALVPGSMIESMDEDTVYIEAAGFTFNPDPDCWTVVHSPYEDVMNKFHSKDQRPESIAKGINAYIVNQITRWHGV